MQSLANKLPILPAVTSPPAFDASTALTRFVLVRTSHAGNVGAAARAIKVMGFHDLVLVAPRWDDVLEREETLAMASGAVDVLAQARVVGSLADALDGVAHVCATAMTPRDFGPPTRAPRAYFEQLRHEALAAPDAAAGTAMPPSMAFVFGSERFGLSNEDVYLSHVCLSVPTAPGYGSLNLAQAVQLIAYEWRQALGSFPVAPRTPEARVASAQAVQSALAHWREALVALGFLDPAAPKKLMPRLNQLINRAQPTEEELHILRGMARAIEAAARERASKK